MRYVQELRTKQQEGVCEVQRHSGWDSYPIRSWIGFSFCIRKKEVGKERCMEDDPCNVTEVTGML